MKKSIFAAVAIAALVAMPTAHAQHRHGGHHVAPAYGHGPRFLVVPAVLHYPYCLPYCYPSGPGYYYSPAPVYYAPPAPPIYIERAPAPQGPCDKYETPQARDECRLRLDGIR